MLSVTMFLNPHYSYIQERLTPSTSICIFSCFLVIYISCKKISLHDLLVIPKCPTFVGLSQLFKLFLSQHFGSWTMFLLMMSSLWRNVNRKTHFKLTTMNIIQLKVNYIIIGEINYFSGPLKWLPPSFEALYYHPPIPQVKYFIVSLHLIISSVVFAFLPSFFL